MILIKAFLQSSTPGISPLSGLDFVGAKCSTHGCCCNDPHFIVLVENASVRNFLEGFRSERLEST